MANCNNLFIDFNKVIKLSEIDREKLKISRNSLRDRIKRGYEKLSDEDRKTHQLKFQTQGSFIMDTIIKPWEDDFDLDDGVYFIGNIPQQNRVNREQIFHDLIIRSIDKDSPNEEIIDKSTCVRVKYVKKNGDDLGFHVDLPIYYKEGINTPELADTKNKWKESDPIAFIEWFETKAKSTFEKAYLVEYFEKGIRSDKYVEWLSDIRKKDVQLRKIVRYLKAWGDYKKSTNIDMPPGIVMTILAGENYCENSQEDIALRDTLISIKGWLERNNYKCPRPTSPQGEDLLASLKPNELEFFKNALSSFVIAANQAVEGNNQKEACMKWQQHLGPRFSCALAKDEIEGAKVHTQRPIIGDTAKSA